MVLNKNTFAEYGRKSWFVAVEIFAPQVP
jgi:hypothetical protein